MLLKYDREELYQKVWERPMLKVAEEYGVSSVALGKVCRKLAVPVPGRGHWAKLAHGHTGARKLPLPKLDPVPVIYRSRGAAEKAANASAERLVSRGAQWRGGAPTDKQIEVLRRSGITAPPEITRGQAAQIISYIIASARKA